MYWKKKTTSLSMENILLSKVYSTFISYACSWRGGTGYALTPPARVDVATNS